MRNTRIKIVKRRSFFHLTRVAIFNVNMIYATMVTVKIRKNDLDTTDCATEYVDKIRQLKDQRILVVFNGAYSW